MFLNNVHILKRSMRIGTVFKNLQRQISKAAFRFLYMLSKCCILKAQTLSFGTVRSEKQN